MTPLIKKVMQFAVVTPNTDDTVKTLRELLNLGPLKVWDFKHPAIFDTTINNLPQPWSMKLAFGWLGNMQFEIIQPTGGQSLYQQYLDEHKQAGLQHLLIDRGDVTYTKMKELLAQANAPIANEAKTNVAVKLGSFTLPPLPMFLAKSMSTVFGYTSTLGTLKMVIETSKYPPGIQPRQGIRMGVPTYWSYGEKKDFETLPKDSLIKDIEGFVVLVKNLSEVKLHYEKLFGSPASSTSHELIFALDTNFIKIAQPEPGSTYEKIMTARGEGLQILEATARYTAAQKNEDAFLKKGFEVNALNDTTILFAHTKMPFEIQIKI